MKAETKAAAAAARDTVPTALAQFFIPITASLQERRPRTMKHGDTFGVFDHNGDALAGPGSPEGIYHRDTRYLSHLYLTVDGHRPLLLSSTIRDDNAVLICDLTNPEIAGPEGERLIARDLVHIRRTRFLWNARAFERMAISNYDSEPRRLRLAIAFAADFADIFEVRGTERARRGELHPPAVEADAVTLAYTGLDGRLRETRLQFEPAPTRIGPERGRLRRRARAPHPQDPLPRDPLRPRLRHPRRRAAPSSPPSATPAGRCATRPRAPPRSPPRTRSSTRPSAARSPTSTCSSPRPSAAPIPTPASPGSPPTSAATR